MAQSIAVFLALFALSFEVGAVPSTENSCAPFFFQKIKHDGRVHTSIVRFQCSGYSCLVEYLARPTPLLEEPACSDREEYDNYFKQLGMAATPAGWVLQDIKSGVLLQVRPNIPYTLAFEPCWDYFNNHDYRYVGGASGHIWEGVNSTHHIWYSLIAQDYKYSACVLSTDSRRYQKKESVPTEPQPPGGVAGGAGHRVISGDFAESTGHRVRWGGVAGGARHRVISGGNLVGGGCAVRDNEVSNNGMCSEKQEVGST